MRLYVRKSPEKNFWKIKPGNKNFGKKVPFSKSQNIKTLFAENFYFKNFFHRTFLVPKFRTILPKTFFREHFYWLQIDVQYTIHTCK